MDNGSLHVYRITVRGQFRDLTPAKREWLLADVDAHEIFASAFTAVGTFTYDLALVAFNLRYEVRIRGEDPSLLAQEQARRQAVEFLTERDLSHRLIRLETMDMADMWEAETLKEGVRAEGAPPQI